MRQPNTLTVYVLPECPGCERARRTAQQVRERCPEACVRLIDLNDIAFPPPGVFSAPTYMLNGRVISLGNPPLDDLLRSLGTCNGGAHGNDS